MKICIVSSSGGHLTEVQCMKSVYQKYKYFFVLNYKVNFKDSRASEIYYISHSERDFKFIINLYEAFKILRKERPDVILSTGAGPAVPFALMAKLFRHKIKIIFIETITRVYRPSLSGRIMYKLSDRFYYQWEELGIYFPKGEYLGQLV